MWDLVQDLAAQKIAELVASTPLRTVTVEYDSDQPGTSLFGGDTFKAGPRRTAVDGEGS